MITEAKTVETGIYKQHIMLNISVFFLYKVITFYIFKIVFFLQILHKEQMHKQHRWDTNTDDDSDGYAGDGLLLQIFWNCNFISQNGEEKHKDFTSKFVYATSAYVCCMRIEICVFYFVERIFSHTISFIWPIVYSLFEKGDNV